MNTAIRIIFSFFGGLIGGVVALIMAVVLELILSILGKPTLTLAGSPVFLIALLVPALLEEFTKTTIAKRLLDLRNSVWTIAGVGIGFGLAETYLSQSEIPLKLSSALLPLVHLIFLLGGFFIVKRFAKKDSTSYIHWLAAGTLLHWGYNVSQVAFLLKP